MARRRRPEPERGGVDVPDWFWDGCNLRRWLRERDGVLDGFHAAKQEWHARCRAWLEERDLVMWDHPTCSYEEFKRIEREEPHRILRRPDA